MTEVTENLPLKNCSQTDYYQIFFARKVYVQNNHKGTEAKTDSIKPKLLRTS